MRTGVGGPAATSRSESTRNGFGGFLRSSSQVAHGHYPRSILFGNGDAGTKIADVLATAELTIQKQLSYGLE